MKGSKKTIVIDGFLDLTDEGNQVLIELQTEDGSPLTPQIILDAVADMLQMKYAMVDSDWNVHPGDLNS